MSGQIANKLYALIVKLTKTNKEFMWLITKMVVFLTIYFVGLLIMFNYPQEHELGIILSFGGLLLFGLTLAQAHIKSLE